jgi:hypothetical protein
MHNLFNWLRAAWSQLSGCTKGFELDNLLQSERLFELRNPPLTPPRATAPHSKST